MIWELDSMTALRDKQRIRRVARSSALFSEGIYTYDSLASSLRTNRAAMAKCRNDFIFILARI